MEYYLAIKRNKPNDTKHNTDEYRKQYAKSKKPDRKDSILNGRIYMTF